MILPKSIRDYEAKTGKKNEEYCFDTRTDPEKKEKITFEVLMEKLKANPIVPGFGFTFPIFSSSKGEYMMQAWRVAELAQVKLIVKAEK